MQNILKQRSQEKKINEELKQKAGLRAAQYEQSLYSFAVFKKTFSSSHNNTASPVVIQTEG